MCDAKPFYVAEDLGKLWKTFENSYYPMTELKVASPFDGEVLTSLQMDDENSCQEKMGRLRNFFSDESNRLSAHQRAKILRKTASLVENNKHDLAKAASEEGGKPITDSLVEIERGILGIHQATNYIDQLHGSQIPMNLSPSGEGHLAFTVPEPRGIVLAISAFNHPFNLAVHQIIPAIATGCPVLMKPALETPVSSLNLITLLREAELPIDACELVLCDNTISEKLAMSHNIDFLSFIGSANVGWYLRSKLSPGVDCALEHGGAAPVIIEADADIESILPGIVKGAFYHAGQVCVSVQRLYIHQKIFKQTMKRLTSLVEALKVGDPLLEDTEVGPLIRQQEIERLERWTREAIAGGAKVATGGERISETCFAPTLLEKPPLNAKVSKKEIFGPILCAYSYSNYSEAIEAANALPFCFQAAVFTQNLDTALDCAKRLKATTVLINEHTAFRVDSMPFGGSGLSGLKMGGIPYSMRDLVAEKMTVIKSTVL